MGANGSCCTQNGCSKEICGKGKSIPDNTIGAYSPDPYPQFDAPLTPVSYGPSGERGHFSEVVTYSPNADKFIGNMYFNNELAALRSLPADGTGRSNHAHSFASGAQYQGDWNGNERHGFGRQVGKGMGGGYGGQDIFGEGCASITAFQEIALMEVACDIEAPNKYRIETTNGKQQILYCRENSECCERIFCPPCRTLIMNARADSDPNSQVMLSMSKPYHCPMIPCAVLPLTCCFGIPCAAMAFQKPAEMIVKDGPAETGNLIGTIFDPPGPAFWCQIDLVIRDKSGQEIYTVGPKTLCSVGQICACVQGEYIPVKDKAGNEVAYIERKPLTLEECCCKVNRFEVNFNKVTKADHKKLIFAAGFLLDLEYWEPQQKNN